MLEDDDPDEAVQASLIDCALRARLEAFATGRRSRALSALVDAHLPEALRVAPARASCLRKAE
jgi:hypothetical protein